MLDIKFLTKNPWPDIKWGEADKPAVIVDGLLYSLKDLEKLKKYEVNFAKLVENFTHNKRMQSEAAEPRR